MACALPLPSRRTLSAEIQNPKGLKKSPAFSIQVYYREGIDCYLPNAFISLHACSQAFASLDEIYTFAPLVTKPSEIIRPMPFAPPVTRTTLSYFRISVLELRHCHYYKKGTLTSKSADVSIINFKFVTTFSVGIL